MFPRQANPGPPSKGWLVCSIRKERKKSKRQALPPVPHHGLVSEPGFPCGLSAYGEGGTGYLFVLLLCPTGQVPSHSPGHLHGHEVHPSTETLGD